MAISILSDNCRTRVISRSELFICYLNKHLCSITICLARIVFKDMTPLIFKTFSKTEIINLTLESRKPRHKELTWDSCFREASVKMWWVS